MPPHGVVVLDNGSGARPANSGLLSTTIAFGSPCVSPSLRNLLREEQTWLIRAQDLLPEVGHFREREANRFWPAVWRRWVVAVVLSLATGVAGGAGYVWTGRPYEADLETLRYHTDIGAFVAQRVIHLSPPERRQLDGLMKWNETAKE